MNINIYDKDLNRILIIGGRFVSCLWSEGYNTTENFSLELQETDEYKAKLKDAFYVGRDDRKTLMVINNFNVKDNKIVISGKQGTRILDDVAFIGTIKENSLVVSSIREAYNASHKYRLLEFPESYNRINIDRIPPKVNQLTIEKLEDGTVKINGRPDLDTVHLIHYEGFNDTLKDKTTYTFWQEFHEKQEKGVFLRLRRTSIATNKFEIFTTAITNFSMMIDKANYTYSLDLVVENKGVIMKDYLNRFMLYEGTEDLPYKRFGDVLVRYPSQISNKSFHELTQAMCQATDCGIKIVKHGKRLEAEIYQPSANPNNIFSPEFGNLGNLGVNFSRENFKNYVIVLGEGEGADRKRFVLDLTNGQDRRELIIDAKDIRMEEGETLEAYNKKLEARGYEKLLEKNNVFEVLFEPLQSIGSRFDLGDLLEVRLPDYGVKLHTRIARFTQKEQDNTTETTVEVGKITILKRR